MYEDIEKLFLKLFVLQREIVYVRTSLKLYVVVNTGGESFLSLWLLSLIMVSKCSFRCCRGVLLLWRNLGWLALVGNPYMNI